MSRIAEDSYYWVMYDDNGKEVKRANTRKELAEMIGRKEDYISNILSKQNHGRQTQIRFQKILKKARGPITEEEKKQIVNEYLLSKLSGNRISIETLSRKYHHDQYKIKNILRENGALEEVVVNLPETKTRTWFPKKIIVQGKEYYDVSSAPTPDGFLEFGIESVKTQKFPEWKRELQRRWNNSKGRRGVNFGVEV